MELKKAFWDEFGRDLLVTVDGSVQFTKPGRDKYSVLFAKWGYALANVHMLADFKRILRKVNTFELDENNKKLAACLSDPLVPANEKAFIRKLLGLSPTESLKGCGKSKHKPLAPLQSPATDRPSGVVLHVDFRQKKPK